MAHVSLYRKYRPDSFADVVGQDHVTETLARAVDTQSWHHAYLFCGPRGTGKTSSARLLAMGLNASTGPTSHPDPNDPNVVAIREGSSPDVIEIDAASNSGVDDVRDLRDKINYSPTQGRLRIYIVDECHMLSNSAWNAFLKTIEEPPGHVVFIFATTEPHKVLPTVLSRTQRFDFRRVSDQVLTDHCKRICVAEQVTITDEALAPIVRAGDGSVRDTLSVLDQVIAFTGNTIDVESVNRVLGTVPSDLLDQLVNAIARADVADAFALVGRVADQGIDLRQFALDAQNHLRELLILSAAPDAGLIEGTPERLAALQAQAASADTERLLFAVEILNDAQVRMRAGNTRLPLEVALAKAVLNDAERAKPVPRLAPTVGTQGSSAPVPTASTQPHTPSQPPSPASPVGTEPNEQQPPSSLAPAPGSEVAEPSGQGEDEPHQRVAVPEPQEYHASELTKAQEEQRTVTSVQPDHAPQPASESVVALDEAEARAEVADDELPPQRESLFSADEDAPAPLPSTPVSPPVGQDVSPDEPTVESEPSPPEPGPQGAFSDHQPEPATTQDVVRETATENTPRLDIATVKRLWDQVLGRIMGESKRIGSIYSQGEPIRVDSKTVTIGYRYQFHADMASEADAKAVASRHMSALLGITVNVVSETNEQAEPTAVPESAVEPAEEIEPLIDDRVVQVDPEQQFQDAVSLVKRELGARDFE